MKSPFSDIQYCVRRIDSSAALACFVYDSDAIFFKKECIAKEQQEYYIIQLVKVTKKAGQ